MNILQNIPEGDKVGFLERKFLELPQAECSVIHRFGPGIYIRELRMRAGTFAIGHAQKYRHLNIVLSGHVSIHNDDGTISEVHAPATFVGEPGRKVGYVHDDVIWQNVYATEETDIEKLEHMFVDKSETWKGAQLLAIPHDRTEDREDFLCAISEYGFTPEIVRAQSEDHRDMISMFGQCAEGVTISDSDIEGKGVFATIPYRANAFISLARIGDKRTPVGRFVNHAKTPNARMERIDGAICLVAVRDIYGSHGGFHGEEITVDYRAVMEMQGLKKVEE